MLFLAHSELFGQPMLCVLLSGRYSNPHVFMESRNLTVVVYQLWVNSSF